MRMIILSSLPLYSGIAVLVGLSCLGLGYLDHETKALSDLFKPGNIIALLLYFVPAFGLSVLFHRYFSKKHTSAKSIFYSVLAGVPLSFTLVILLFVLCGHQLVK